MQADAYAAIYKPSRLSHVTNDPALSFFSNVNSHCIILGFNVNFRSFSNVKSQESNDFNFNSCAILRVRRQIRLNRFIFDENMMEIHLLPTYDFAHTKIKKLIFNPKILEFVGDVGIISYKSHLFWKVTYFTQKLLQSNLC